MKYLLPILFLSCAPHLYQFGKNLDHFDVCKSHYVYQNGCIELYQCDSGANYYCMDNVQEISDDELVEIARKKIREYQRKQKGKVKI